jgi:endonuclease YncB( thermonuclease family)
MPTKAISSLVFVVLFSVYLVAQPKMIGRVSEVLDGQTILVESTHGAKFPVRLTCFEAPDENQELFDVVKGHLTNIVLGREISFSPGSSSRVVVNGLDVSAQMLRDGAGWNVSPVCTGSQDVLNSYTANESLAKQEKRGVWGISNLQPSSLMTEEVVNSPDPFNDPKVASAAWRSLGPSVESVFGYEYSSIENNKCDGKVFSVVDGDTVNILTDSNQQITVRLAGIDAPEKNQAYGWAAKQYLSEQIFGKSVRCESNKRDRYGRLVGKILLNGIDVNLQMVSGCHAWHYKDYAKEQTESDRTLYGNAEISSRSRQCGLWQDSGAVKPWEFRKNRFYSSYVRPPDDYEASQSSTGGFMSGIGSSSRGGSSSGAGKTVHVRSYTRSDGTFVRSHTRSAPSRGRY